MAGKLVHLFDFCANNIFGPKSTSLGSCFGPLPAYMYLFTPIKSEFFTNQTLDTCKASYLRKFNYSSWPGSDVE